MLVVNGWVGDREAVGALLAGEQSGGGSGTERRSQMKDNFRCGILVLQDLLLPGRPRRPLTFEVGGSVSLWPEYSAFCRQAPLPT